MKWDECFSNSMIKKDKLRLNFQFVWIILFMMKRESKQRKTSPADSNPIIPLIRGRKGERQALSLNHVQEWKKINQKDVIITEANGVFRFMRCDWGSFLWRRMKPTSVVSTTDHTDRNSLVYYDRNKAKVSSIHFKNKKFLCWWKNKKMTLFPL